MLASRPLSRRPGGRLLAIGHLADAYPTCKIVISIHVGQAGVQIGNACCKPFITRFFHSAHSSALGELYTVEHGLSVRRTTFWAFDSLLSLLSAGWTFGGKFPIRERWRVLDVLLRYADCCHPFAKKAFSLLCRNRPRQICATIDLR